MSEPTEPAGDVGAATPAPEPQPEWTSWIDHESIREGGEPDPDDRLHRR